MASTVEHIGARSAYRSGTSLYFHLPPEWLALGIGKDRIVYSVTDVLRGEVRYYRRDRRGANRHTLSREGRNGAKVTIPRTACKRLGINRFSTVTLSMSRGGVLIVRKG